MDVGVEHLLPGRLAVRLHEVQPVRFQRRPDGPGDAPGGPEHLGRRSGVHVGQRLAVAFRNDERVARRDRRDVEEREGGLVLVHPDGGRVLGDDVTERAVSRTRPQVPDDRSSPPRNTS